MALKFTATHEVWLVGEKYDAGEHEIARPSRELQRHAAAALAVGALVDVEGHDEEHVQSQEDGETALAAAMGTADPVTGVWDGPWYQDNVDLHAFVQEQIAAEKAAAEAEGGEAE